MPTFDWLMPLLYILLGAFAFFVLLQVWNHFHAPVDPRSVYSTTHRVTPRPKPIPEQYWRWDALTAREREIARLVAQGLRTADVARELQLSTRTVETHLQHIYGKLGLRSRTELALLLQQFEEQTPPTPQSKNLQGPTAPH